MAKFSDAQVRSYRDRKIAEKQKDEAIEVAGIDLLKSVLSELVSTAKANPIMGVVLAAVTVDVLGQAKVIRPATEQFLMISIGAAFGISITDEALQTAASVLSVLNPFKSGGSPASDPAELIKPVPTTLVENPRTTSAGAPSGASALTALIPKAIPPVV